MRALVVFGHPNLSSFNGAILDVVTSELKQVGAQIKVKDLYRMGFNPVLTVEDFQKLRSATPPADIKQEQDDITWADMIIMISPVWWHSVTAMLRGYIDRVFSYGFAYHYVGPKPEGLLIGKKGLLITTSGASEEIDKYTHMTDYIRHTFVGGFFGFCGITEADYMNCFNVVNVGDEERRKMLEQVGSFIRGKLL